MQHLERQSTLDAAYLSRAAHGVEHIACNASTPMLLLP